VSTRSFIRPAITAMLITSVCGLGPTDRETRAQEPTVSPSCPPPRSSNFFSRMRASCAETMDRWKAENQESHWGYPEYFGRQAFGSANQVAMHAMKQNGFAAQCILYRSDFYPPDSPDAHLLNPYGTARLERVINRSIRAGIPIGLERSSGNGELDELRRAHLLAHPLLQNLIHSVDEIRLITNPMGLDAVEASQHYLQGQLGSINQGFSDSGGSSSAGGALLFGGSAGSSGGDQGGGGF
jgi:hypothetical protein